MGLDQQQKEFKMASLKIYEMVTERVVTAIQDAIRDAENGNKNAIAPWHKPWFENGTPVNLITKKPYRGINVFLLSMMGYTSPYFLSFNQVKNLGGNVKKGEKGIPVVFWKWIVKNEDEDGNKLDKPKNIPFLRYYTVFNVAQTEGIPEKKIPAIKTRIFNPIEDGDKIIANMPNRPTMTHDQARAYYMPSLDVVNMPKHELFESDNAYYSTCFHELVHSTGHASRLNRKEVTDANSFGSHNYSLEELVAEMGAVFLCNEIGITSTFDNSLAYLKSWLSKLKEDTKLLVMASGRAQKATDYIIGEKEEVIEEEETTEE
jgi:antirestriction protein ArdC